MTVERQTHVKVWECRPAPRMYGYSAREVASALVWVARRRSYRQVEKSRRGDIHKPDEEPGEEPAPGARPESTPAPAGAAGGF